MADEIKFKVSGDTAAARQAVNDLRGDTNALFNAFTQLRIGLTQLGRGDLGGIPNLIRVFQISSEISATTLAMGGFTAGALAAAGAAAALEAKAISLTLEMAKLAGHLDDLSKETGLSPEFLQRLQALGDLGGVKIDTITASYEKFQRVIVGADENSKQAQRSLQKLGITAKEAASDPEAAFKKLLEVLAENQGSAAATELAFELAGRSGTKLLRIAEENAKAAADFGQTLDREALRSLAALDDEVVKLGLTAKRVTGQIAGEMAPQVTGAIIDIQKALGANEGAFKSFGEIAATTLLGVRAIARQTAADLRFSKEMLGGMAEAAIALAKRDPVGIANSLIKKVPLPPSFDETLGGIIIEDKIREAMQFAQDALARQHKTKTIPTIPRPAKSQVDEEAKAQLELLRIQEQAATRLANATISAARAEFEQRKIGIETLERITIEAENRMLAAKLKVFAAERRAVEESKLKDTEKAVRLAQLGEREASARQTAGDKILQVQSERYRREEQLRKQNEADEQKTAERERRLESERLKDLQTYLKARIRILEQARRDVLDANSAELGALRQRGELDPGNQALQREIIQRRAQLERDSAEHIHEQKLADIQKDAEAALAVENLTRQQIEEIERASNQRRAAEELRFQSEIRQITLQRWADLQKANPTSDFNIYGPAVAAQISYWEELLERQLTLWEKLRLAATNYAKTLKTDMSVAFERAKDVIGNFQRAAAAATNAFVDSGGSLKAAGKAFAQTLAAPYIEAAKTAAAYHAAAAVGSLAVWDLRGFALHTLAAVGFAALGAAATNLLSGAGASSSTNSALGNQLTGTRQSENTLATERRYEYIEKDAAGVRQGNIVIKLEMNTPHFIKEVQGAVAQDHREYGPIRQATENLISGMPLTTS